MKDNAVRAALRHGTALGRVVRCVEKQAYEECAEQKRLAFEADKKDGRTRGKWKEIPYRYDLENDHFYIPDELAYGAISQFSKKGSDPLTFLFVVIACIAMISLCCFLLPEVLQLADNFIGVFYGG